MSAELSLKDRIMAGPLWLGPSLGSMSPAVAEVCGLAGCDFIWIEVEHSGIDLMQLEHMCRAAELGGTVPLFRIQDGSRPAVLRSLEVGAKILIVPQIHTPQQAAAVAEYGKFPPLGKRGYNLGSRGMAYGNLAPTAEETIARANRETCLIPQIESVQAVQNAEAIIATEGIDGVFFGPGDLSADMGIPSQWDNEDLIAAGERVITLAREHGKVAATTCPTDEMTRRWMAAGVHMLIVGGDLGAMRAGLAARMAELRAP